MNQPRQSSCPETGAKSFGVWRTILCAVLMLVFFAMAGLVALLCRLTLMSFVGPLCVSALLSAILALPYCRLWQKLTLCSRTWVNAIVHIAACTVFFMLLFYGLNWLCRDTASHHSTEARVEKVYTETRRRSKRVRRGIYTQGEAYSVFVADISIGGHTRSTDISYDAYRGLRKGDTLQVEIERGLFGFDIIDNASLMKQISQRAALRKKYRRRPPQHIRDRLHHPAK